MGGDAVALPCMRMGPAVVMVSMVLVNALTAGAREGAQDLQGRQASTTPNASQTAHTSNRAVNGRTSSTDGGQGVRAPHGRHFVTVKFDYDFTETPACSATVKAACVAAFVAYDISAGVKHRTKLFEIPLPAKPIGLVQGITGKSPTKLDFESEKHLVSVVAREPDGKESKHRVCTTWIDIP